MYIPPSRPLCFFLSSDSFIFSFLFQLLPHWFNLLVRRFVCFRSRFFFFRLCIGFASSNPSHWRADLLNLPYLVDVCVPKADGSVFPFIFLFLSFCVVRFVSQFCLWRVSFFHYCYVFFFLLSRGLMAEAPFSTSRITTL